MVFDILGEYFVCYVTIFVVACYTLEKGSLRAYTASLCFTQIEMHDFHGEFYGTPRDAWSL